MNRKLLLFIILFGIVLRFYKLGEVPIGFHKDEAFLGYNAYSILKTGHDITGNFLPIHLKSFLYSPAGYSYFSIPFIWILGLSAFSVRFASAFFGSLTIIVSYFLAVELFSWSKLKKKISLTTALLLTVSPWHIVLSRTATENTIVVFFIALGTLLCIHWLRKYDLKFLLLSFFSFGITLLIYQAPRAFLPLFIPLLIYSFWQQKQKNNFYLLIGIFTIVIILPLLLILKSPDLSLRIKTVSIFATQQTQLLVDEQIREDGVSSVNPKISRIFHNKLLGYTAQITQNYFNHFSYNFLFTDNVLPKRYMVINQSLLYLFELPLLLVGLYMLTRSGQKTGLLILGWILLAPIGSALTFDDIPNLQRTLLIFPALSMVSGFGAVSIFSITNGIIRKTSLIVFCILATYGLVFFIHQYFIHVNHHVTIYRSEGYKELVSSVNSILPKYKKAVITDRESSPAIFFLFYNKFDPQTFITDTKNSSIHDYDRINFANYEFSQEECPLKETTLPDGHISVNGQKDTLYVNSGLCKDSPSIHAIKTIQRPDGTTVFKIVSYLK